MSAKKILQNVGLTLTLLACIWIIFYVGVSKSTPQVPPEIQVEAGTITISIEGLYENQSVPISNGETALAVLEALYKQDPAVQLSTKEYTGLGVLVDGIGEFKNGTNGKYWQYLVNGVMPQVGAGAYVLKNGDRVEWFFDQSQE